MKIQMSLHLEVLKNQPKIVKMTFKVHNKIIAYKVNNKLVKTMFQLKKKIIWLKIQVNGRFPHKWREATVRIYNITIVRIYNN